MTYTPDSRIIGVSTLSAAQLTAAVLDLRGRRDAPEGVAQSYDSNDVALIVRGYHRQAAAVGIDPVIALAQMGHETGWLTEWWAQRPRRNPAGIGVTGATKTLPARASKPEGSWVHRSTADGMRVWEEGCSFGSWVNHAIPAHLGRLHVYAVRATYDIKLTRAQQRARTYALGVRPLALSYHGEAPTLQGLEGTWAMPGPNYADKLAEMANAIVAIAERTR